MIVSLDESTTNWQLCAIRVAVAVSLLIKYGFDHWWGMARCFDSSPPSLTKSRYYSDSGAAVRVFLSPAVYRGVYRVRFAAAGLLFLGVLPQLCSLITAAWCFYEYTFDRKHNTLFIGTLAVILAITPGTNNYYSIQALLDAKSSEPFFSIESKVGSFQISQLAVMLFVTIVYASSAWHKLKSRQFTSGQTLQMTFRQLAEVRLKLKRRHREYYFPAIFTRTMAIGPPQNVAKRWKIPARLVIALEAILPILLIFKTTWGLAVAMGILLHLGFTSIMPKRLLSFSIAAVSTYLAFWWV